MNRHIFSSFYAPKWHRSNISVDTSTFISAVVQKYAEQMPT